MSNLQLIKNMHTLRKQYQLTQASLAKKLNITRQAYSNYEQGKRTPDLDTLLYLADLYQVNLEDFIRANIQEQGVFEHSPRCTKLAMDFEERNSLHLSEHELDIILRYRELPEERKAAFDVMLMAQK